MYGVLQLVQRPFLRSQECTKTLERGKNMNEKNILAELSKPFEDHEIEWRAQTFTEKNGSIRALMLPYIDSRAAMQRLDDVLGVNWKDTYEKMDINGQQAFQCSISIFENNQWITRTDGAECTDIESVKGGYSAAFKRAAVKFGIGRYLYDLEPQWCTIEQRGQHYVKGKINGRFVNGYVTPPTLSRLIQNNSNKNNNQPVHNEQPQGPLQTQQGQQQTQQSQTSTQQHNPMPQKAIQILNALIDKLKFSKDLIPYLLERAGSKARAFEQASGEENERVFHALTAVDKYLHACRQNRLSLEQVIYYAQIVAKMEFKSIFEMVYELDYEKARQATEIIREDFQKNVTA